MLGIRRLAALHDRGDPELREDRREPLAGDDRHDRQVQRLGGRRDRPAIVGRSAALSVASVVNAAARDSRTSRAWLSRFSTLIRLIEPCVSP